MTGEGGPAVCVFCKRHPVEPSWRPFCSERCRLQDLARWADGTYRVPGEPVELSVNGKVVARGELVEVEGHLGVRVLALVG